MPCCVNYVNDRTFFLKQYRSSLHISLDTPSLLLPIIYKFQYLHSHHISYCSLQLLTFRVHYFFCHNYLSETLLFYLFSSFNVAIAMLTTKPATTMNKILHRTSRLNCAMMAHIIAMHQPNKIKYAIGAVCSMLYGSTLISNVHSIRLMMKQTLPII